MLNQELETILLTWTIYLIVLLHPPTSQFTHLLKHNQHLSQPHARCAEDPDIPQFNVSGTALESALIVKRLDTPGTLAANYNAINYNSTLICCTA